MNRLRDLVEFCELLMEKHDPLEHGHGLGTAGLAAKLARRAGMKNGEIRLLRYAMRIHDVGKVLIAEGVINKPTELTDVERFMMQAHTIKASDVFEKTTLDPAIKEVVVAVIRHHHENYDGTGYPDKLVGEAIPLVARIARIADTYDALIDARSYHPHHTNSEALAEMKRCRNCYDPKLFELFLEMMTEGPPEAMGDAD